MILKLYFGNIEFYIKSSIPIPLRKKEKNFLTPVSEIKKTITVDFVTTELFTSPSGKLLHYDNHCEIYLNNKIETRYYLDNLHHVYYAYGLAHKDNLTITYNLNSNMIDNVNFSIINLLQMENYLLSEQGLVLHCAYLMFQNEGILFTAPSGTGKTTQATLWTNHVPNSYIINGDRGLLQKENGTWYVGGFPIHGTAQECFNQKYPIKAIIVVRQNCSDFITELSISEKIKLLFSEMTVNLWNPSATTRALDLINDLVSHVTVLQLNCTMKETAVTILKKYLYGEK